MIVFELSLFLIDSSIFFAFFDWYGAFKITIFSTSNFWVLEVYFAVFSGVLLGKLTEFEVEEGKEWDLKDESLQNESNDVELDDLSEISSIVWVMFGEFCFVP